MGFGNLGLDDELVQNAITQENKADQSEIESSYDSAIADEEYGYTNPYYDYGDNSSGTSNTTNKQETTHTSATGRWRPKKTHTKNKWWSCFTISY